VGFGALLLHLTLARSGREALLPEDFPPAYFAVAAISLLSLFFFAPLPRDAGAEISGKREAPAARAVAADSTPHPAE
jgi:hypothetical protein